VKLIHKDINTEFLKIYNCIFRILKQHSSRVWGLISKLITVIICDKMLWCLLVMCEYNNTALRRVLAAFVAVQKQYLWVLSMYLALFHAGTKNSEVTLRFL
jgi:hypothetical protein